MKIYNEIITIFNDETQQWDTLYEDSFEYNGPMAMAITFGTSIDVSGTIYSTDVHKIKGAFYSVPSSSYVYSQSGQVMNSDPEGDTMTVDRLEDGQIIYIQSEDRLIQASYVNPYTDEVTWVDFTWPGSGGAGFPFAGAAVITGSMLISGSVSDEPLLNVAGDISTSGNFYGNIESPGSVGPQKLKPIISSSGAMLTGTKYIQIGQNAKISGSLASTQIAIGANAHASGEDEGSPHTVNWSTIAIGDGVKTGGKYGGDIAIGYNASASFGYGKVTGFPTATGHPGYIWNLGAIALGFKARAYGGIAIGSQATVARPTSVFCYDSIAIGAAAIIYNSRNSLAIGFRAEVSMSDNSGIINLSGAPQTVTNKDTFVLIGSSSLNNPFKVGISTTTPTKTLTVSGSISASGDLYLENGQYLRWSNNNVNTSIIATGTSLHLYANSHLGLYPDNDLIIHHGVTEWVRFVGNERQLHITGSLIISGASSAGEASLEVIPNNAAAYGIHISGSTYANVPLMVMTQVDDGDPTHGKGDFIKGFGLNSDSRSAAFVIGQTAGGAGTLELMTSASDGGEGHGTPAPYAHTSFGDASTGGQSWVNFHSQSVNNAFFGIGIKPDTHLHVSGNIKQVGGTADFGEDSVSIDGAAGTVVASTAMYVGTETVNTSSIFKIPFGGYVKTTTKNTYYVQTYPGYHYWNTSLGTSIGSEGFNSTTRYSQYIAEGGEKVNKVNGWIAPRRFNEESCSMYLWKVSPTDGAGGNITYTQMAPSQSFRVVLPPANIRIDMDVHPDSRSLADGDALVFGFKRTTPTGGGLDATEYYDFNATLELEK